MKKLLEAIAFGLNLSISLCSAADSASIKSYIEKSTILNAENNPDSSIIFSSEALRLSINEGNRKGLASSYYQLGKSYIQKGDLTLATQYILSSDSLFKLLNDSSGIAQTNLQLGLLEYTQKNYPDALPYFETSIRIAKRLGNNKLASTIHYLKGLIYIELGELDKAEVLLTEAMKLKKLNADETGYYECLSGLAELNYKRKKYPEALILYKQCLDFFRQNKNPAGEAISHIGLAKTFYVTNRPDSALSHYLIGHKISRDNNFLNGILKSSKSIADIYQIRKEFDKAFYFLHEYYDTHDSIYNTDNTRKIAKLQYQLSLANQQIEINRLSRQKANYQFWFLLLISTTFFLIIVTIIIFRSNRFKQKSNKELENTLRDLKNAQDQLIRSEKLASLGHLTAGVAHELKNPLNFIINFSDDSSEILSEYSESGLPEQNQILRNLKINLEKIQTHGLRANSIITNMMMHARHSDEVKLPTDLSKLLRETIDLAYQGMRAVHPAFYCRMNMYIPDVKVIVNVIQQEIGRIILNMLNNSFYATMQRIATESNYTPEIKITLERLDKSAEITIEDNGIGMDEKVRARIFEPFFTTKPTGEGTGLGLSMSYDMIQSNGGTISVESELGKFTRFVIVLPL